MISIYETKFYKKELKKVGKMKPNPMKRFMSKMAAANFLIMSAISRTIFQGYHAPDPWGLGFEENEHFGALESATTYTGYSGDKHRELKWEAVQYAIEALYEIYPKLEKKFKTDIPTVGQLEESILLLVGSRERMLDR